MRKFRLLFLAVAAALLVPTALLVHRALQSVDLERRMRHQAVAERLFDEMERALSEIMAREEERPFGHYRFFSTPPGEPGGAVRSPLAEAPALPFVVGYFQIDPDGGLHSPLRPRDEERTGVASDWQLSAQASGVIAEIERTVGNYWRVNAGAAPGHAAAAAQLPGSTVELSERPSQVPAPPAAARDESAKRQVSAFEALRALNKGIEQRADRQAKISNEYDPGSRQWQALDESAQGFTGGLEADRAARKERSADRLNEATRFELSPMVGRAIDERHLLLYRTVVHEGQGYRQGLLLDIDRLGAWLREQALGSTELAAYATVTFASTAIRAPAVASEFAYAHRFAEPFDGVSARLVLTALPGVGGATYLYALSALLLVAVVLGLAALDHMVSVVLRFAEQRGNFVAAVTHELKTPLTAIRMYGEMLRDGMVPSESKRDEYHRHITAESERLTRLVNNVLEFSRLERRGRKVRPEAGPVGPVVQEVAALVRPHVESEGFVLRVEIEPDLPPVRFERYALMQVLFNLVDNAVKYANGSAEKEITFRCRRGGDGVCLAVCDKGPGVPVRQLPKIFHPFYRAESELTRRSKGTGLGLALVRGLVDAMGARVTGRNRPEGGFEVEIAFPTEPRLRPINDVAGTRRE